MINLLLALMAANNEPTLRGAINSAGLTSNLKLCFDAADIDSYSGSGQKWLDRSGNGYDFFLGSASSSQSSDPTFTGSAGQVQSGTYWALDGGDLFLYDSSNETWMQNLHKDNATFSVLAAVYIPNLSSTACLCSTQSSATASGIGLELTAAELPRLQVGNDVSNTSVAADTALNTGAWNIIGLSLNEGGGNVSFWYLNGAYNQVSASNTFDGTYASPSSVASTATFTIGARSSAGSDTLPNGSRLAFFGMWEGAALTKANFDTLYGILRTRFGL